MVENSYKIKFGCDKTKCFVAAFLGSCEKIVQNCGGVQIFDLDNDTYATVF